MSIKITHAILYRKDMGQRYALFRKNTIRKTILLMKNTIQSIAFFRQNSTEKTHFCGVVLIFRNVRLIPYRLIYVLNQTTVHKKHHAQHNQNIGIFVIF